MKKYIKSLVFTFCGIAYSDLIFFPKKGFHFIPFFNKIQIPIVILLLISLLVIIATEIPENKFSSKINKFKKPSLLFFLISSLLIFNEIFFSFNFNQGFEFFIIAIFSIPIPFIVSDLIIPFEIKNIYILLIGLFLTISTIIYFQFIYTRYEDYWNGIAIVFIHHWIRNWLIFIGVNLIAIYCFLETKKKNTANMCLENDKI